MTNSPATFQSFINGIFVKLITKGEVVVYMNDIIILAKTLEELHKRTEEVLQILQKHDLFLQPEKCEFEHQEIEYLGLII